jgi:alpha-tubulin suppressor-like RCC1 family protein
MAFAASASYTLYTPPPTEFNLFSWGWNSNGQLGMNNLTSRSSPVQVGSTAIWKEVHSGDFHTLGIRNNGSLWSWGNSAFGELGQGSTATRSSPVQVGNLTNWSKVSTGNNHSLAIKTDGTLWSWGYNDNGELGLGDRTSRSSPVQIGSGTTWAKIACGANHSLAIKTDGTLWAWGASTAGETGLGITGIGASGRLSPSQVGALTDWAEIAGGNYFTLAVKTDGTLWTWGDNPNGNLGTGNTTDRSSPGQVGSLTNWKYVAASQGQTNNCHSLAVKTDGTLWAWGVNGGALGNSLTLQRTSPVQIGNLTNWANVEAGAQTSIGLKTDGTIWTWGLNSNGELGLGDTTTRSSPVQVGSLTTWYGIMAGRNHMHAFRS